jgi:N-acetylmuramoyl-L-alanine amidase
LDALPDLLTTLVDGQVILTPEHTLLVQDQARRAPTSGSEEEAESEVPFAIAIDAGHGGGDTGVRGEDGALLEKELTRDVASRLAHLLEENMGVRVVLVRPEDQDVPLANRPAEANHQMASCLISLHAGAYPIPERRGCEVYLFGAPDSWPVEQPLDRDTTPWPALALRYQEQSMALAKSIEQRWTATVSIPFNGIAVARPAPLEGADMPAVVVELGYLSNPADAAFLSSEKGRSLVADTLYQAIAEVRQLLTARSRPDQEGRESAE